MYAVQSEWSGNYFLWDTSRVCVEVRDLYKGEPRCYQLRHRSLGEFEKLTLDPAIDRAKKAGLIDERIEEALRSFKDELRNKYSHFNIQKITKDLVFDRSIEKNLATGEEKIVALTPNTPTLQIIAKDRLDEEQVLKVFKFADKLVIHLYQSILGQTS